MGSWPIVGCVEWWVCHSVLAQFPWDTDAVTEVCMTGFRWETNDHTSEGRKEGRKWNWEEACYSATC